MVKESFFILAKILSGGGQRVRHRFKDPLAAGWKTPGFDPGATWGVKR